MKISKQAACAALVFGFFVMGRDWAIASADPIPGVDVIVKKNGMAIKVGDCLAGGGHVVKVRGKWTCVGMPAHKK